MNCRKRGMAKPKAPARPADKGKKYTAKTSYGDKDGMERKPVDAGSTPKTGEVLSWG